MTEKKKRKTGVDYATRYTMCVYSHDTQLHEKKKKKKKYQR